MDSITRSESCGNSPKNDFAEQLTIDLYSGNREELEKVLVENASWLILGKKRLDGRAAILEELGSPEILGLKELRVRHAISHGKRGAVDGLLVKRDGSRIEACTLIEFQGAAGVKVKEITSYLVEVPRE